MKMYGETCNSSDKWLGVDAVEETGWEDLLLYYRMKHVQYVVLASIVFTIALYFTVAGFLQWRFYIQQKDKATNWKCQPRKFMTKMELQQVITHSVTNLVVCSTLSGILATYVLNGGTLSRLYFNVADYGWVYLFTSTAATFFYHEGASYYFHRLLHRPFFYKRIHHLHHGISYPNAFNALYVHPFEAITFQVILLSPLFLVPLHCFSLVTCTLYVYYYGMISHSGIDMTSLLPWQPAVRFHDDHHKYFNVNYGFNLYFFDRCHGTTSGRKKTPRLPSSGRLPID